MKHELPDHWDFDSEFLSDAANLPAYIPSIDLPALGPGRRALRSDMAGCFLTNTSLEHELHSSPHALVIEHTHAIYDDREQRRNMLIEGACLRLPELQLNRHMLAIGPTGVGKSSQVISPITAALIADPHRTVVTFDAKGDQYGVIRRLVAESDRSSRSIVRINLTNPQVSIGWNPLTPNMSRAEVLAIATQLVMASESASSNDSQFWRNNSIDLITEAIVGLASDPRETLTLPRLREVFGLPRRELMRWLREHGCQTFHDFVASGSHNAETCLSDFRTRVVALHDEAICAVLSHDELRIATLFERPTVLVVEMDETRVDIQRPIFNILVQQVFGRGIDAAARGPDTRLQFPTSVIIDEFGSAVGAIPGFPTYLNTLRSRRISVIASVQSTSQIHSLYRQDAGSVLAGFSSKIFFSQVEMVDARLASEMSGTMVSQIGDRFLPRPLFLPEEISRPPTHPVLGRPLTMLLVDAPPVQVYLTPHYRLPRFHAALGKEAQRRNRSRRRKPLVYTPTTIPTRVSETSGWSPAQIRHRYEQVKRRIGWVSQDNAPPHEQARKIDRRRSAWSRYERRCGFDERALLRLVEELAIRKATMSEFLSARARCRTYQPMAVLHYLDYLRAKNPVGHIPIRQQDL